MESRLQTPIKNLEMDGPDIAGDMMNFFQINGIITHCVRGNGKKSNYRFKKDKN